MNYKLSTRAITQIFFFIFYYFNIYGRNKIAVPVFIKVVLLLNDVKWVKKPFCFLFLSYVKEETSLSRSIFLFLFFYTT